ncbi:hypothetical protein M4D55_04530 [Metabacillus idriensis]|nr:MULTISPECIES: hypothetical protein [Metabacillus]MCM3595049.1 hypothetical protein [Metabacillus idriensis]
MTMQAKNKIQELGKSPLFRNSLEKFLKISEMYTNKNEAKLKYNPLFERKYSRMIKKITNEDDVYMFRDRNNRFVFTIEKDNNDKDVTILIDVLDRNDVRTRLKNKLVGK